MKKSNQSSGAGQVQHLKSLNLLQTDQYGRKQFSVNASTTFQPPKPSEQHPSLASPSKSTKSQLNLPPPEKKKLLMPVNRDFKPEEVVGKTLTITAQTEADKQSVFYCETCKVQLKDSNAWYDHINGKKHNQMLGMSMVVERVSVDKVKAKLAGLKRKAEVQIESIEDIERRLDQQEEEEREKKNKRRKTKENEEVKAIIDDEIEFNEEDITAFGLPFDFGSTKKK